MTVSNEYGASPDIGRLLGGLLANPGALSMLSSLLGGLGDGGATPPPTPPPPPHDGPCPDDAGHHPPPILPAIRHEDHRTRLLEALRPYLSPERCNMIDTILRILELMDILQKRR